MSLRRKITLLSPIPLSRPWARGLVFAAVWLIIARYISWRVFTTVLPAHGAWREVGWVWFCFAIEILALFDALILYLAFLRTSDRRAEADGHEARLRTLSPDQLPTVDVYIPTYNEPFEVLEKTITGALCLDYPNVRLWVLDDGRRPWLKAFCEGKGIGYLTRSDNAHAKAGNINHALTKTDGGFRRRVRRRFRAAAELPDAYDRLLRRSADRNRPGTARLSTITIRCRPTWRCVSRCQTINAFFSKRSCPAATLGTPPSAAAQTR